MSYYRPPQLRYVMRVCDRCLSEKSSKVEVVFDKEDLRKRSNKRRMLAVKMDLCEKCIDDLLHKFGKFKVGFLKDGDSEEDGGSGRQERQARFPGV